MPAWLDVAEKEFHRGDVVEVQGRIHNPRIVMYHQSCTLHARDDETPWCSAFVNWCIDQAGLNPTRSALARSWLKWGVPSEPKRGAITVFSRGMGGHVAFYVGEEPGRVIVLGGNQSNRISYGSYKKADLLGFRWPKVSDFREPRKDG